MNTTFSEAGLARVLEAVKAPSDAQRYVRAMIDGDHSALVRIEQQHGLFGYPPDIVSIGLQAIQEGKDAHTVIDAYIAGDQP